MPLSPSDHYHFTNETAISDVDGVQPSAEARLKNEEIVMDYAAWYFNGLVWYCRERLQFCCETSRFGTPVTTVVAETLDEIQSILFESDGQA